MDTGQIDVSRARVKTRSRTLAQLCVPYTGEISLRLRRHTAAALRIRATHGPQALRGVSILVLHCHLLVSVAGAEPAIASWLTHGLLLHELAAAFEHANAELQPAAPTPHTSPRNTKRRQRRRLHLQSAPVSSN